MVVILLLTPSATNGCDTNNNDESNDSTASTTSTATTAIPASRFHTDGETKSATAPTIPIISKSSPHIPKNIVYDKKYRKKYRKPHNVSFEFDRPQQPNAIPKPPRRQKRDQPKSQLNEDKNYVRHVTRVNFSDYYDSQVEVGDGEAEAVTKEGEFLPYIFETLFLSFLDKFGFPNFKGPIWSEGAFFLNFYSILRTVSLY